MRRVLFVAAWAILALLPLRASGSLRSTFTVYQPFITDNDIEIAPVTYNVLANTEMLMEMTCWPNRSRDRDRKVSRQENAAAAAGFTASGTAWSGRTASDTLFAVLTIPTRVPAIEGEPDTLLVQTTVECLKATAGQYYRPQVRYLAVRVAGPRRYGHYGGVFDVSAYRCGPPRRSPW